MVHIAQSLVFCVVFREPVLFFWPLVGLSLLLITIKHFIFYNKSHIYISLSVIQPLILDVEHGDSRHLSV